MPSDLEGASRATSGKNSLAIISVAEAGRKSQALFSEPGGWFPKVAVPTGVGRLGQPFAVDRGSSGAWKLVGRERVGDNFRVGRDTLGMSIV